MASSKLYLLKLSQPHRAPDGVLIIAGTQVAAVIGLITH